MEKFDITKLNLISLKIKKILIMIRECGNKIWFLKLKIRNFSIKFALKKFDSIWQEFVPKRKRATSNIFFYTEHI